MQIEADKPTDGEHIQALLENAIDTLPEKQQSVFRLRYFQALSYKVIAQQTGTSQGALKASYHHAVKKIEDFFKAL